MATAEEGADEGPAEHRRDLGRRVRELRIAEGWTQERLAEAAGQMDRSYLAEIETGVANPSVDILQRLAKAMGVKIRDLFCE